ncbi:MAG: MBL fold metallo-hydrolase [Clostridia bacterium]|nr:MBL fold metallo-hydrolase [Clostridia bacterium]
MNHTPALTALGGSAENGRNCYLLSSPASNILLDCGVKRVVTGEYVGEYPLLTREIAAGIDAVFLSHAHEDHCAALPLLYALGYDGCVYGSQETIDAAPAMIKKWITFVKKHHGTLPFTDEDAARIRYKPLSLGSGYLKDMRIMTGRSGHTIGSMWIALGYEHTGWQLFYSGDMCTCAASLAYDIPPACGFAVLNCAYAGQILDQDAQYHMLTALAEKTVRDSGVLLLPVPPTGRGCDMLLHLADTFPHAQIYAAQSIVSNARALFSKSEWLRGSPKDAAALDTVHTLNTAEEYAAACSDAPCILLVTDGMLTTEHGQLCLRLLGQSDKNHVVISGHAAPGTMGSNLLDNAWRKEHALAIQAGKMVIKVHLDDRDALAMQERLCAKHTVFFHAPARHCQRVIAAYAESGFSAGILSPGNTLYL